MTVNERRVSGIGTFPPQDYADCLQTARNIFNKARKVHMDMRLFWFIAHQFIYICILYWAVVTI